MTFYKDYKDIEAVLFIPLLKMPKNKIPSNDTTA